jgi:hypothetical protein
MWFDTVLLDDLDSELPQTKAKNSSINICHTKDLEQDQTLGGKN